MHIIKKQKKIGVYGIFDIVHQVIKTSTYSKKSRYFIASITSDKHVTKSRWLCTRVFTTFNLASLQLVIMSLSITILSHCYYFKK